MSILLLISLIIAAVSGVFSLVRQLQMLQQNSYYPSRYFGWIKDGFSVWLAVLSILFCVSSLIYSSSKDALHLVFTAIILAIRIPLCIRTQKKSIKKLVFTPRVKRLFAAAIIIQAILILIYAVLPLSLAGEICLVISLMLSLITPLLTFAMWGITLPIEKAFAKWYICDAKKILKRHTNLKVVGITGSYGKTTTKFILTRILSEKYNVLCTPQSFNTPMGVVRTIRESMKPQTQIFVCEMGAKNIGDIKEICDIVNPDMGIITSVGPQHLETFHSVDNVFKTKFELADAVKLKDGDVFVNGESKEIADRINEGFRVYGLDSSKEFYAENISYGAFGSSFDLVLGGERISVKTKLLGLHSIIDITAAAAVAYTLGVSPEDIKYAIGTLKATEHRLELKSYINGSLLIDDAYNSNPEGCLEAVRVLGSFEGMKKVIITPGLVELGSKEYECNYALGLEAAKYCDIIILVGQNRSKPMREAVEKSDFNTDSLHIASSFAEAVSIYSPLADDNTVLLIENDLPDNYLN